MTFLDYLELLRQRLVVATAVIGATAFLAMALAFARGPEYNAEARVRALPPATGSSAAELLSREQTDLVTESELLRSTKVAERVKLKLGTPKADNDALIDSIRVNALTGSAIMVVTAKAATPDAAIALANTFSASYLESRREDANSRLDSFAKGAAEKLNAAITRRAEIEGQLAKTNPTSDAANVLRNEAVDAESDIATYKDQLRASNDRRAINEGFGEITRPATNATPVRIASPVRSLVFGLLIGVVLAIAAALLLDALSNTVRTREDARSHSGAEVLAVIPDDVDWDDSEVARLVTDADPLSPVAEAYRTLRQNLRVAMTGHEGPKSILITSAGAGEGKSTTAANLTLAYADTGETALVVDSDLRQPRLHDFFATEDSPGLSDILEHDLDPAETVRWLRPRVGFVPAGAPVDRPDRVLLQADLPYLVGELSQAVTAGTPGRKRLAANGEANGKRSAIRTDGTVLIDAAPILAAAEVSSLSAVVDGVVLVMRAGVTSRESIANAAEQVRKGGGRLLGVVLVGVRQDASTGPTGRYGRYTKVLTRATAAKTANKV